MTRGPAAAALLAGLTLVTACRQVRSEATTRADSTELARRGAHLARALAHPDSGASRAAPLARWVLGGDLSEISGLALTADGRLFTHGDETGRVFEIDYRGGARIRQFSIGSAAVHEDFEAITAVNDDLFLLASDGKLYQFQAGAEGEHVAYTIHDTRLKQECEFEGVAFDSTSNSLLMACKNVHETGPLRDSLVIYRWRLPRGSGSRPPRLTVPLASVIGSNGWKGLHPSDITVDPLSGNYVIIAAQERALIEITPAGAVVFARPLPAGLNHAEGVAITRDSILMIGTEAGTRAAAITLYRWP